MYTSERVLFYLFRMPVWKRIETTKQLVDPVWRTSRQNWDGIEKKLTKNTPRTWLRFKSSLPSLGIEGTWIATASCDFANSPATHKGTSLWSPSGVHGSFPRNVLHTFQNQSGPPFALVSVIIPCNIFEGPQTMFKGAKLDKEHREGML